MKWNKALSIEEIALIATGLESYKNMETVKDFATVQFPPCSLEDVERGIPQQREAEQNKLYERYQEALEIKDALEREVYIVDPYNTDVEHEALKNTHLVISIRAQTEEGWIVADRCLITRESAALWFYDLDLDKAKRLLPKVEDLYKQNEALTQLLATPQQAPQHSSQKPEKPESAIRTSEELLLKSVGILSLIISNEKNSLKNGNNPNASAIAETIKRKAAELGLEFEKASNLNRDITNGLSAIKNELS